MMTKKTEEKILAIIKYNKKRILGKRTSKDMQLYLSGANAALEHVLEMTR